MINYYILSPFFQIRIAAGIYDNIEWCVVAVKSHLFYFKQTGFHSALHTIGLWIYKHRSKQEKLKHRIDNGHSFIWICWEPRSKKQDLSHTAHSSGWTKGKLTGQNIRRLFQVCQCLEREFGPHRGTLLRPGCHCFLVQLIILIWGSFCMT